MPIAITTTTTVRVQEVSFDKSIPSDDLTHWRSIARAKLLQRQQAIPLDWHIDPNLISDDKLNVIDIPFSCGILSEDEVEITETRADELVRKLLNRVYTSYQVTLAFCKRAAIAQQLTNCLSEIFFDDALRNAEKVDNDYRRSGIPLGPLHGLPVSLKDCFHIEGQDTTIGFTANAFRPATLEQESEITKIMRTSGAILFCKTSVPLAMMSGETYNNIYGYTSNPYNRNRSSGGSSGGESALLALRGSPLGVGTDVGGSIRIPAAWCGLYSLKPSFGRFPNYGCEAGLTGQETVRNTIGPIAASIGAIELWGRAVTDSMPWLRDPDCLPIPWRTVKVPERLCFGMMLDDGIVKPLPPVTRALLEAKAALERAGHTVIAFTIDDPLYTEDLKHTMYRSAAANLLSETLAKTGEPWPQGFDMLQRLIASKSGHEGLSSGDITPPVPSSIHLPVTVSELWSAQSRRTAYAKRILDSWVATQLFTGTGREMDALLTPCTPGPASDRYRFSYDNYTSLWNVLDYCGTTLPVTRVSALDDQKPSYMGRNDVETRVWEEYSPEAVVDCPVAIQLVGRRLNEEYLLEMTRICDQALKTYSKLGSENSVA